MKTHQDHPPMAISVGKEAPSSTVLAVPVGNEAKSITVSPTAIRVGKKETPVPQAAQLPKHWSWKHWCLFWFSAMLSALVAGILFGIAAPVIVVILSVALGFGIKCWQEESSKGKSAMDDPSVRSDVKPVSTAFKKCPFCAEVIRYEATLCRFCQKEQPAGVATPIASPDAHLEQPVCTGTNHADKKTQADQAKGVCAVFVLVLLFVAWNGGFFGSSVKSLFPTSTPPVVELDAGVKFLTEHLGVRFSDWRWDGGTLKGKVTRSLPSKTGFSVPAPIGGQLWCTRYDKNGTKLDDASLSGPGSISPGETAEVTLVFFDSDHRTAKIVLHSQ